MRRSYIDWFNGRFFGSIRFFLLFNSAAFCFGILFAVAARFVG